MSFDRTQTASNYNSCWKSDICSQVSDSFLFEDDNIQRRQYNKVPTNQKTSQVYREKRNKNNEAVRKSRIKSKFLNKKIKIKNECCKKLASMYKGENDRMLSAFKTLNNFIRKHGSSNSNEIHHVQKLMESDKCLQYTFEKNTDDMKRKYAQTLKDLHTELESEYSNY